ncbi:ABC transporter permease [Mycobacterium sp. TNTM28]|uniref:ABC transporter permease n=1 Tax=[Mycobacterium] fortunisiensis TaxID=2600579 RepID=A0ABS6KGQ1_9MYCO|nr:ABC transporter permease [[Mycobacterium] fortunisiensis]MBU9762727.1 ABC transporter permease [[Mycobacterium] fortunisiensis]
MLSTPDPAAVHTETPGHEPSAALRATGIVVALTVAIAIVAIAFALPASRSKPHDVPIGVAGPQVATSQIAHTLDQQAPGAFSVTYYPGEDALREATENRTVYGGITFGPQGATLLTATGGSPAVAQLLTQIGNAMAAHSGMTLHTEDLAPPTDQDPRGTGLAASALPITLAGMLPAIALVLVLRREVWTRLTATLVFSALAGTTVAALLYYVFGSIDSNFWGVAAGLTLGIAAAGLCMLGLGSLFGKVGLAVGAVLALLLGNPLSGLTAAPEMLPSGWGRLGQLLPQGAAATLLRSTAYFDGAGADTAIVVLSCWALAGLFLVVIAALRRSGRSAPKMQPRGTR